jgi:hypothetical protein
MTEQEKALPQCPPLRVAAFTSVDLPEYATLRLEPQDAPAAVAELRRHADLPCVFVISPDQRPLMAEVLQLLKAVRSPCYPHAVFIAGSSASFPADPGVEVVSVPSLQPQGLGAEISRFARRRLVFDRTRLRLTNASPLPAQVDVLVVGAGITGLYAASKLQERGLSVCLIEQGDCIGGIWSRYANATSRVNTSEAAYRLREPGPRANRDHSSSAEILADALVLAEKVSSRLFTQARAEKIERHDGGYRTRIARNGQSGSVDSRGVILAINDRVGVPREAAWKNQDAYQGILANGISDDVAGLDWRDKRVVIIGMGAFAVENARTALEAGARQVTVLCRRHGTVCPKVIDYLNFASAYDERFEHERKANIRNMMLWKRLYDLSRATQPECWMERIKHPGHTISVSDIWFIGHHLNRLATVTGTVGGMFEHGLLVADGRLEAEVVVNCLGFERNTPAAIALSGSTMMHNNNYLDRDFMYLADGYIDDNAHNSFFGSSVLEMVKFYVEVYLEFFGHPSFERMLSAEGIEKIPIAERKWSHYITGAKALMRAYPRIFELARDQVQRRTANILETHDLPAYIAENKREWLDTHRLLAGKPMAESEYLPFVFEKLLESRPL